MIDYNVRAERMGWLPSAPQLKTNPLQVVRDAQAAALDPKDYAVKALKDGSLKMSCEDPDHPDNWPRNLFVWRSNLLGSCGKGHEYFLKHLLGTSHGVQGKDLGADDAKPEEVVVARQGARRQARPAGHARLPHEHDLPVLRHRAADRDVVREERPQHQRHASVHPSAVDRRWTRRGSRAATGTSTRASRRSSAKCASAISAWSSELVLTPLMHDTPAELAQPFDVKDWKRGECELIPGKTAPQMTVVERDYPNVYKRFTALGPADGQGRQRRQGHRLEHADRGDAARRAERRRHRAGATQGMPQIETDIDACEVILQLAPETNGHVAVKAWEALGKQTGPRPRAPGAAPRGREDPLPRHPGAAAQDHHLADVERHRERDRLVQRRLHQRARADPLAHADRAPAVLPGPPVDARVRRGLLELPPAGGSEDHGRHPRRQAQRQSRDRAELHHAAPEVGHPLDLHRQPDDAHA